MARLAKAFYCLVALLCATLTCIGMSTAFAEESIDVGQLNWPPVEKAAGYIVEISKDKDFKDAKQYKVSEPSLRLEGYSIGVYFFRVASIDEFEKVYDFSAPAKITIDTLPAVLKTPRNGFEIEAKDAKVKVELGWEEAAGLEIQTIEIATDKEFAKKIISANTEENHYSKIFDAKQSTYYWRIISSNPEKTRKIFSEVYSFTIKMPPTLPPPVLVAPEDEKSFHGKDLGKQKIKFEIEPIAGAKEYEFLITPTSEFGTNETKAIVSKKNVIFVELSTNFYVWQARVKDNLDRVSESEDKNTFQVQGKLSQPKLITNSKTRYFLGRLETVPVFLSWTPSEEATSYQVQLSSTKAFKKNLRTETFKSTEFRMELKPGRYYMRVRARAKGYIDSKWSEPTRFLVAKRMPWRHKMHVRAGYSYRFIHSIVNTDQTGGNIDGSMAAGYYAGIDYIPHQLFRLDIDFSSSSGTLAKENLGTHPKQKSAAIKAMNITSDARYYYIPQSTMSDLGLYVGLGYSYQKRTELTVRPTTAYYDELGAYVSPALTTREYKMHGPTFGLGVNYSLTYSSEIAFETKFFLPIKYVDINGKSAFMLHNKGIFSQLLTKFLTLNLGVGFTYGKINFDSTYQSGSDTFSEIELQLGLGYFF